MNKFIFILLALSAVLISCGPPSQGSPKIVDLIEPVGTEELKADRIYQLILGHCVNNVPRLDKLQAVAREFDWQELSKDQATMVAPMEPDAWFKGWLVRDETAGALMIGIARAILDGKSMASCSVATQSADVEIVMSKLTVALSLTKPIMDEHQAGQRTRIWQTDYPATGTLIIVTDAKAIDLDAFSFGISTPDN